MFQYYIVWHSIVDCLFAPVLLWHSAVCFPAKLNYPSISYIISNVPARHKKLLKLNHPGLFSNAILMFNKHINKLFILVVWIFIEKSHIVGPCPEGRVFDIPLRQSLGVRYFTCTLTIWSMEYLTCAKGRISDLPPGQGMWPALRVRSGCDGRMVSVSDSQPQNRGFKSRQKASQLIKIRPVWATGGDNSASVHSAINEYQAIDRDRPRLPVAPWSM